MLENEPVNNNGEQQESSLIMNVTDTQAERPQSHGNANNNFRQGEAHEEESQDDEEE